MKRLKVATGFLTIALFTASVQAASTEEIIASCNDCHGENGVSTHADVPTIAGFSETSITDMMLAFVDEVRSEVSTKYRHGDTTRAETSMVAIAKELSEEQIEEIAVHYSEQEFVAAAQPFDASVVAAGKKLHKKRCAKCHEDGGSSPDDDAGILAGQWTEFLKQVFADYKSGAREGDEEMIKKINALSDDQISSLLNYYASLQ